MAKASRIVMRFAGLVGLVGEGGGGSVDGTGCGCRRGLVRIVHRSRW